MLPPLVALNIGTTKRANDSSVAIDVVSKRLKVSDFDLFQLQRYAVLVIYAKDMFSSITKFQRRESGQMPNIHIEDTLVYKAITEKENGQELWSSLEGYMKPLFLKSFDLNAMETISYQNALNYLLLFTMFPTVDVSLQQLLSTYSIQLPVDDQAKLESIMTILRRPTLSTHEDDSEYRWSFPEGMQVSDKLVKDMTENLNWTPHFVKSLTIPLSTAGQPVSTYSSSSVWTAVPAFDASRPIDSHSLQISRSAAWEVNSWISSKYLQSV